jgi:hypothetical protein
MAQNKLVPVPQFLVEGFTSSHAQSINREGSPMMVENAVKRGSNLTEGMNKARSYAQSLYAKKGIAEHIKGMKEGMLKEQTAVLMSNWLRATSYMSEDTRSSSIANFNKYAFPLIRAILPEMASPRLFSMQTMFGPTSQIFYFDYLYGSTRGTVTAGQKLFENNDPQYGASDIEQELLATGNTVQTQFVGVFSYAPILAGTITITDGIQIVTDDGQGNLVGSVNGAGNNTVNYTTGVYDVTFAIAPDANPITADYTVDSEGNENGIPQVDLILTSSPVTARSLKLRMRYSLEAQYSLRDTLGLEAEAEAVTAMGAEIAFEVDQQNFNNVFRVALDKRNDPFFTFNITPTTGISFRDWKENIVDYFIRASSEILQQSGRAIGNKIVAGTQVTNVIESLVPRFQPTSYRAARGIHFIGVLDGRWEIFKNLNMNDFEYLTLFKGEEFLFAGYVYAPWILAFTTPTTILDDMQARKGMGSLYGQKIVNPKYFLKSKIKKS